jgi:hypothetical protein
MFLFLPTTLVVAQSELGGGLSLSSGFDHNSKFQLNKILTDMGANKIPQWGTFTSIGTHLDYRNVVYYLDLGIGNMRMRKKQTWSINMLTKLAIGYQLFLPHENSLVFSGTLSYELYNVYSSLSKGSFDMKTGALTPTQFNVELHQFRAGANIAWRNEFTYLGIGYDIGCIPTSWKSDNVTISNNIKERIDRIYIYVAYDIRKF